MKEFLGKYKKKIIKIIILFLVIIAVGVAIYFVLRHFNITDIDKLQSIIESCGVYGWLVFILLQVLVTVLLSFAPGGSLTFIVLSTYLFSNKWIGFLCCFTGVMISSILMDFLGRFGLVKIMQKIIGDDDLKKATDLINKYGKTYIPLFYLFPLFPDDGICCVVGGMKVNFWYHLLCIALCRGIGVFTIVFGMNIIPDSITNFTSTNPFDYLVVVLIAAFLIVAMFLIAYEINKFIEKTKDNKKENNKINK